MVEMLVHHLNILPYSLPFLSDFIIFAIILRNTIYAFIVTSLIVTVREMVEMLVHHLNILPYSLPFLSDFIIFAIILRNTIYVNLGHIHKK